MTEPPAVTPDFRLKLAKILGLTTSTFDHEALAAIRRANELMTGAGLRWPDIITPAMERATEAAPDASGATYHKAQWRAFYHEAWIWRAHLNDRDRAFLEGIDGRTEISEKQHKWLADIVARTAEIAARETAARRAA